MDQGDTTPARRVLLRRGSIRAALAALLASAALFLSAGRLGWSGAWLFVACLLAGQLVNAAVLAHVNPSLLAERQRRERPREAWDLIIFASLGLLALAVVIVAGLDRRFGWTEPLPPWSLAVAFPLVAFGDAVFLWSMALNRFFSKFVRVRAEQRVVSAGPYQWVRHPGYLGWLCFWFGLVILLRSPIALALAGLSVPIVAVRAVLEERVLRDELDGYSGYAGRVRKRLIPLIW